MTQTKSQQTSILLMEDFDQSEMASTLPAWSKGAYLTHSEEEMITASLPVYDPARFARTGSPLLVLADFPSSSDPEQIDEEAVQLSHPRHVTKSWTRRTLMMLMTLFGLAMAVIGFVSYIHV